MTRQMMSEYYNENVRIVLKSITFEDGSVSYVFCRYYRCDNKTPWDVESRFQSPCFTDVRDRYLKELSSLTHHLH